MDEELWGERGGEGVEDMLHTVTTTLEKALERDDRSKRARKKKVKDKKKKKKHT